MPGNEWVDRFEALQSDREIKRLARVDPVALELERLAAMPVEQAVVTLASSLKQVFHPSDVAVELIKLHVGRAVAHCALAYPDVKTFARRMYDSRNPGFDSDQGVICLTGPAGGGKTAILDAIERVLPRQTPVDLGPAHGRRTVVSCAHIKIRPRMTTSEVRVSVCAVAEAGEEADIRRTAWNDCAMRRLCYLNGVALSIVDETQFMTQSATASTKVSVTLMAMYYLGLPMTFSANFSLLKILLRRPPQEVQRLLQWCIGIPYEEARCPDWLATINAYSRVAPSVLRLEEVASAQELHQFTAGNKRFLIRLLCHAYRCARHSGRSSLDHSDVLLALRSPELSVLRQEVEAQQRQDIENKEQAGFAGLWCPLEGVVWMKGGRQQDASRKARDQRIAKAVVDSGLTCAERAAFASQSLAAGRAAGVSSGKPVARSRTRTAAALLANEAKYQ